MTTQKMNQNKYMKNKTDNDFNSEVGWNQSQLFYNYLYEIDMSYMESYFMSNWDKMYKCFKLKYMKVRVFILSAATPEEKKKLEDDQTIRNQLSKFKEGDSDHANKWNSEIINNVLDIIEKKMIIVDELMSKVGMNILLEKIKEYKPAALAMDDF